MSIKTKIGLAGACAAVLFSANAILPAQAADFSRILSEADFNTHVVGKKLTLDDNYIIIKSSGTVDGMWGGKALAGTWKWQDGYWCRVLGSSSKEDCQLWTVNGNEHLVTRDRGKGKHFTYTVK